MSENYDLVYQSRRKCEIYRDTGESKNYTDYALIVHLYTVQTVLLNLVIAAAYLVQ